MTACPIPQNSPAPRYRPGPQSEQAETPVETPMETMAFTDIEDAWFWFITAYEARHSGAKIVAGIGSLPRPCEPLDILRVVDRLYRQRRLFIDHLRVLNFYGKRGSPPDPRRPKEQKAYTIWHDALARIEPALQSKGILQ